MAGGFAAVCGERPLDLVAIMVRVTFKDNEVYTYIARGIDCALFIDNQISWEYFLNNCVQIL